MPNHSTAPALVRTLGDRRLSRRAFLLGVPVSLAGTALAACAPRTMPPEPVPAIPNPPLRSVAGLPSPASEVGADELAIFLAFSALLTGVSALDPTIGAVYLAHLQATHAADLAALYEQAGVTAPAAPTTLEAIEATGVFDQEPLRQLADQIITLWYTGKYTTAEEEEVVVTFVDALAWKVLNFTVPPTICGAPGFWAYPPRDAILSS